MSRFKLIYLLWLFIISLHTISAQISDKRLCVDKECNVPISHAKTLLRYSSPDYRILSFAPNVDVVIYSKSAGSREDLWGAEINGKRGYVPKHMLRETKILAKPTILVDTETENATDTQQVPLQVEPDKVQEPFEVVDGTTFYLSPQEITPSATESPIQSTALPSDDNGEKSISQEQDNSANLLNKKESETDSEELTVDDDDEEEENANEVEDEDEDQEVEDKSSEKSDQTIQESVDQLKKLPDSVIKEESTATVQPEASKEILNQEELAKENTSEGPSLKESESVSLDVKTAQADEASIETPSESVPPQDIEITTLRPEIDVPLPVIDNFEVTPKPLDVEDLKTVTEAIPTLPPLSLFSVNDHSESVIASEKEKDHEDFIKVNPPEVVFPNGNDNFDSVISSEKEKIVQEETQHFNTSEVENATSEEMQILETETTEPIVAMIEDVPKVLIKDPIEEHFSKEENLDINNNIEQVRDSKEIDTSETVGNKDENEALTKETMEKIESEEKEDSEGFFSGVMAFLASGSSENNEEEERENIEKETYEDIKEEKDKIIEDVKGDTEEEKYATVEENFNEEDTFKKLKEFVSVPNFNEEEINSATTQQVHEKSEEVNILDNKEEKLEESASIFHMDILTFNSDIFLYLVTTAISVILFLFGYIAFDKNKREGPLIAKINKLEKELIIAVKENQILQEKLVTDSGYETNDKVSTEVVENLKTELIEMVKVKSALEEQVQSLEKELENSTEVGMELNRMLTEILQSDGGSDVLRANVESLQRQLIEQQSTINSINETLSMATTENHELKLELELSNKKVIDLQTELDKLLLNILKIEEEKEAQQSTLDSELSSLRQKYEEVKSKLRAKEEESENENKQTQRRLEQAERKLELKIREYEVLTDTLRQLKLKNKDETIESLLEVGEIKAELQLLKSENQKFVEKLQYEQELKSSFEKKLQVTLDELHSLRNKYEESDKLKVETQTKLQVLTNYFKDREAEWQKELSKHEALWAEKEGEATSTTERIKFMQDQLQNYKAQTESLKQEIMSQEIELKSQISVLEKKAHENWVSARQAERKLEEAKQEAAQLRHRLTLRERTLQEDKNQQRLQSPIEQNGDLVVPPMESPASPPLLYGTRDHITKSPPLPGLPPFLPPPPGVPFMPPPLHGVPFIPPPPPNMFPGDHRPPPLGRMSSPPLNSRYSPSSRGYSPYDRNSSSPSDSEYGTSPPHRGYSPFSDRRDYKRPPPNKNNRSLMKGGSSGSGHSNESLEKIRQPSKV